MAERNQKSSRQKVPDKPTQSPDLPPGARGNLPPIQPERVTRQTAKDLAKKPANQTQT
ncbi:hypothetical protein GX563_06105 [Candidatus Bathyarchaeota archaeon]|nr:hypothetical protein [Candidatus Bathyarchaeota archaeon]